MFIVQVPLVFWKADYEGSETIADQTTEIVSESIRRSRMRCHQKRDYLNETEKSAESVCPGGDTAKELALAIFNIVPGVIWIQRL